MNEFRELLFRGQTRKKGEKVFMNGDPVPGNWVYGGVLQGKGDHSIIYAVNEQGKFDDKFPVHTDTLGQYIGLKDKNGKKIFEGDIVGSKVGPLIIEFIDNDQWCAFCAIHGTHDYDECYFLSEFSNGGKDDNSVGVEIIGNIHDNPELLEVQP